MSYFNTLTCLKRIHLLYSIIFIHSLMIHNLIYVLFVWICILIQIKSVWSQWRILTTLIKIIFAQNNIICNLCFAREINILTSLFYIFSPYFHILVLGLWSRPLGIHWYYFLFHRHQRRQSLTLLFLWIKLTYPRLPLSLIYYYFIKINKYYKNRIDSNKIVSFSIHI